MPTLASPAVTSASASARFDDERTCLKSDTNEAGVTPSNRFA